MKKDDVYQFLFDNPITYTYNPVRVDLIGGSYKVGFFVRDEKELNEKNKWRFVENNNSVKYKESNSDSKHTTIINGNEVERITLTLATRQKIFL